MTATPSGVTPLFELFLDLPHPNASKECPGAFLIPAPHAATTITPDQVTRFAFPDVIIHDSDNTRLNKYDVYATQTTSTSFTFSWQTSDGSRLHGHVRRYLPPHLTARTRYDVGRRGERALVLLTRHCTADALFRSILKSIEAISSQQVTGTAHIHNGNPQQWFLNQLVKFHQRMATNYTISEKPIIASIPNLELDDENFSAVDTHRFIFPNALVSNHESHHNAAILPLLRCVGVSHCLRIVSALLSERRVIFCSASPTRLTSCSHAAISILQTGGLSWHHVYIPVLSPHIHTMLAAPYPYLIGILHESVLNQTDAVGEVLYVQLDQNSLETRNIPESQVMERLPDMVVSVSADPTMMSPCDALIQDLLDILKQDKKMLYGDNTLERVGETAAKAKEAVKKTFFKLRDRFQQRESADLVEQEAAPLVDSMAADYIYTEGCHNETAEHEVRITFTIFFLTFHGDVRWLLTNANGAVSLDRNRFLQTKQREYTAGSPMWQLTKNFCQTQLLQEFSKARISSIASHTNVGVDGILFLQCEQYLRQKHMDFGIATAQRIARHIADNSPLRLTGMPQTNARQTAMNLTSNKAYDSPDTNRMMAQLVEQCRECSSVLTDVMSVIWLRLRDCKGLQWKHGFLALQLLRNLLYHGPLAAISEATDGLSKIRSLKFYENMRAQCAQQVQSAAASVYMLLVDRAKLFNVRRMCADRRRKLQQQGTVSQRRRQQSAKVGVAFRQIHALMHPSASSGTIVQLPPKSQTMSRGFSNGTPQTPVGGGTEDILDLFGDMSVGTPAPTTTVAQDFDVFASPPATSRAPIRQDSAEHFAPQPPKPPQEQPFLPQPPVQEKQQSFGQSYQSQPQLQQIQQPVVVPPQSQGQFPPQQQLSPQRIHQQPYQTSFLPQQRQHLLQAHGVPFNVHPHASSGYQAGAPTVNQGYSQTQPPAFAALPNPPGSVVPQHQQGMPQPPPPPQQQAAARMAFDPFARN